MIEFKQINCHHSILCNDHMCQLMSTDKKPVVYLMQEPYYNRYGRLVGIPVGYNAFGEKKSRAIIVAPSFMNLVYSHEFSTADITVCLLDLGNEKTFIMSGYLDIKKDPVHPFLVKLADNVVSSNGQAIYGLDANSHSVLWNSADSNSRGLDLEDFIMSYNLDICNQGDKFTYEPEYSSAKTIIDITLAQGVNGIKSWRVSEEYHFSDHNMIIFELDKVIDSKPKKMPKTDWVKYNRLLELGDSNILQWDHKTIDNEAELIVSSITNTIKKCTFYKVIKPYEKKWYNDDLKLEKDQVMKLAKITKANRTAFNESALKDAKKSYFKNCRRAKRLCWQNYTDLIESPKNMSKLNRILNKNDNNKLGLLKHPDGTFAKTMGESIDLAMESYFPGSRLIEPEMAQSASLTPNRGKKLFGSSENSFINPDEATSAKITPNRGKMLFELSESSFINPMKVKLAFESFGPDKMPGPDGIQPKALQALDNSARSRITQLFKACIELGYVPKIWCKSKLVLIPKPGKKDYSVSGSFRPISLSNFLLKALERLILWHLEETSLKEFPIGFNQYAYKMGSSTENCISALVNEVESQIKQGQYALAVFCDIEGAFNCLKTISALNAMKKHNIPDQIVTWFKFYLENRYVECDLEGVKKVRKIQNGVAQGGVCSPLIWNLVFMEFLNLFKGPVRSIGFADDGALIIKGKFPDIMVDYMQSALNSAEEWGVQNGLRLNPQKTIPMFFFNHSMKYPKKRLTMSGVELPYSEHTRYLGIVLDCRLRWDMHIKQKILSATKKVMMIKKAIGTIWGPQPKALKFAYNGIILPSLTYGSIVWSRVCTKETIKTKLNRLTRLICMAMMPLRKNSPTAGLQVVLDFPPLDLKIEEIALKAMLRVLPKVSLKWEGVGKNGYGHILYGTKKLLKLGIDPKNTDLCASLSVTKGFTVDLDSLKSGQVIPEGNMICYTDGSKMENQTGYGIGITQGNYLFNSDNGQLPSEASVFQAEVFAIHKACDLLMEKSTDKVTFFTDSQSALLALAGVKINSKTVEKCIDKLNELAKTRNVELKWVRGHSGSSGNEFADSEAKLGTINAHNRVMISSPISLAKRKINDAMLKGWTNRWTDKKRKDEYKQTKLWFPVIDRRKSKNLLSLSRVQLGHIVQLITGHNRLMYHQSKMSNVDPTCRQCQEVEETTWHIFTDCPAFWRERKDIFHHPFLTKKKGEENYHLRWTTNQFITYAKRCRLFELNSGLDITQIL